MSILNSVFDVLRDKGRTIALSVVALLSGFAMFGSWKETTALQAVRAVVAATFNANPNDAPPTVWMERIQALHRLRELAKQREDKLIPTWDVPGDDPAIAWVKQWLRGDSDTTDIPPPNPAKESGQ